MRYLAVALLLLFTSPVFAAYPYDAVGRVEAGGSGTMVYVEGNQGLVITNWHVVPTISETEVYWPAVNARRKCKTIWADKNLDLALLVCNNPPVKAAPHRAPVGNFFVSAGFPYYQRANLHWQASLGLKLKENVLFLTAQPVPGMSGGAAFDCGGYLVGVVEAHNETDGIVISGHAFVNSLAKFKDPKTWIPNADHVEDPRDIDYAPQDGEIRTIRYNVKTAPELPWPGKSVGSSNSRTPDCIREVRVKAPYQRAWAGMSRGRSGLATRMRGVRFAGGPLPHASVAQMAERQFCKLHVVCSSHTRGSYARRH